MKNIQFKYDDRIINFTIDGNTEVGNDEVLINLDDNLIKVHDWDQSGFMIFPFLHQKQFTDLVEGITLLIRNLIGTNDSNFMLENYHHYVDDILHAKVSLVLKNCLPISLLPIPKSKIIDRVSNEIGIVTTLIPSHTDEIEEVFCLRIVRPSKPDNNPLHRDVWLNRLRNAINIYAPLAGSTPKSCLGIVPGSHYWKESEIERTSAGAKVNGIQFTVPAVTGSKHEINISRPSPGPNEFLIFSPYLIHGGGINENSDKTRVSLEMRFWRKI